MKLRYAIANVHRLRVELHVYRKVPDSSWKFLVPLARDVIGYVQDADGDSAQGG